MYSLFKSLVYNNNNNNKRNNDFFNIPNTLNVCYFILFKNI